MTGSASGVGRSRVQTSVLWVGAGIGVYGLSSFAFLAVAGQALGQGSSYTALALMWTLLNAIGIGLYLPVEQETGRSIASLASLERPTAPAIIGPARYAASSLLVIAVIVALTRGQVTDLMFEGKSGITAVFVLALAGLALAYFVRGILAGTGRFPRYGSQLAIDGALRVIGAAVLAGQGNADPVVFGALLALAPAIASGLAMIRPGHLLTRAPRMAMRVPSPLTPLVLASLASQALANAGPVAVQLLKAPGDDVTAGNLVNSITIARIPLFLFAAVQAVFLPTLAQHVALEARRRYVAALRTATLLTAAVGVLGVLASWAVGPEAVQLLFGPTFEIARGDIVLLALSSALFMNVQVIVQGLLARSRDFAATTAWLVGLASMCVSLVLPLPLTTRISVALVVGSAGALVAAAHALCRTLRHWKNEVSHGGNA